MNFKFTEDEQSIVDMISQYAAEKVAPRAHDVDEKEEFPVETWKELADMGMFGIAFDTAYECGRKEKEKNYEDKISMQAHRSIARAGDGAFDCAVGCADSFCGRADGDYRNQKRYIGGTCSESRYGSRSFYAQCP